MLNFNFKDVTTLFVFTFLINLSFAQKVEVTGKVVDTNGEVVPFANVIFTSSSQSSNLNGAITEEDGSFLLELKKDIYSVEVSIVGIKSVSRNYDLTDTKRKVDLGNLIVNTSYELDEVVVNTSKSSYKLDLDKKVYDVTQDIVSKGGTLSDVMQNIPSIVVDPDGSILIRGSQSITILLDGRPSNLANTTELLRTIPAASIERIEVITNPSAKYTSEGSGGIINVVLKKGAKGELGSSLEVFAGHRINSGINYNVNNNTEKLSWFINAGLGHSEPKGRNETYIDNFDVQPSESFQNSERIRNQTYYLTNAGLNVKVGNGSLNASTTYRIADANNENNTIYTDYNGDTLFQSSARFESEKEDNNYIQTSLGYTYNLNKDEKHQLALDINYEETNEDEMAAINETVSFPQTLDTIRDFSFNDQNQQQLTVALNYSNPLSEATFLETGYIGRISTIKNQFTVETNRNNETTIIPEFTDTTEYGEDVHAFYGQISSSFDKDISYSLGLRAELSNIKLVSLKDNLDQKKVYTNWFPSLIIGKTFSSEDKIQFSLSRRIRRPPSWAVTPFSSFTDNRNIVVANIDINPSYTLSNELSFQTKLSKKTDLNTTLYYRATKDEMEFFVEKRTLTINDEVTDYFASTMANIGNYYAYGSEIGLNFKPVNWLTTYAEITLNGFKQVGTYRGASFDGEGLLVYGRLSASISLSNTSKLQLQNYYRGPIETGQYRRKGFYILNIGFSKELFKNKVFLTFNVNDTFNSALRKVTTFGSDFTRDLTLQYRRRQINASLTYRFDSKKSEEKKGNQYDKFEIIN